MHELICQAIRDRIVLRFEYDGGARTVEPHALGVSTAGNEVLSGYQRGGFSRSEAPTGWRLFDVGRMSGLRAGSEKFPGPRPGYNPADSSIATVHCHLVQTFKHFILFYDVSPDYLTRRGEFRDQHLSLAWQAQSRGELVLGGALGEPADGAVLLFWSESPDTAEEFARTDPYVLNGLVTQWRVRAWSTVIGSDAATPVHPKKH